MPRRPADFAPKAALLESPFGEAEARALAARFGFAADPFAVPGHPWVESVEAPRRTLREWLNGAANHYRASTSHRLPTAKEKRQRLADIEEAAQRGQRERLDGLLERTGQELPGVWLVGAPFGEVLARIEEVKPALARPRPPVRGAKRLQGVRAKMGEAPAMRILVRELSAIWCAGTRRGAGKIALDPYDKPDARTCLAFLCEATKILGVDQTPGSLVGLHNRWGI